MSLVYHGSILLYSALGVGTLVSPIEGLKHVILLLANVVGGRVGTLVSPIEGLKLQ